MVLLPRLLQTCTGILNSSTPQLTASVILGIIGFAWYIYVFFSPFTTISLFTASAVALSILMTLAVHAYTRKRSARGGDARKHYARKTDRKDFLLWTTPTSTAIPRSRRFRFGHTTSWSFLSGTLANWRH
jgi:hypothetical protein